MAPLLFEDKEKGKRLCLVFERCKGCEICIEVCPRNVLEGLSELDPKLRHLTRLNGGEECSFCREYGLICPDFSIYVLPTEY